MVLAGSEGQPEVLTDLSAFLEVKSRCVGQTLEAWKLKKPSPFATQNLGGHVDDPLIHQA